MNTVCVYMDSAERCAYDEMRKQMVIELDDRQIDVKSAAALSGKLTQMVCGRANGRWLMERIHMEVR